MSKARYSAKERFMCVVEGHAELRIVPQIYRNEAHAPSPEHLLQIEN
jgi:hypothetical protein